MLGENPSSASWARPGVRCVCVDTRPGKHPDSQLLPSLLRGRIYTITAVSWDEFPAPAVQVEGHGKFGEQAARDGHWLRLSRFRPLVERTQEQDEALELFAHHMTLAHLLFQNTPEGPAAREELRRLTSRSVLGDHDPACVGALAAWDALTAHYAKDEKDE